jgi:hypothetical protein
LGRISEGVWKSDPPALDLLDYHKGHANVRIPVDFFILGQTCIARCGSITDIEIIIVKIIDDNLFPLGKSLGILGKIVPTDNV